MAHAIEVLSALLAVPVAMLRLLMSHGTALPTQPGRHEEDTGAYALLTRGRNAENPFSLLLIFSWCSFSNTQSDILASLPHLSAWQAVVS